MKKIVNATLLCSLVLSSTYADDITFLENFKVEGEARALHSATFNENSENINATAFGFALGAKTQNSEGFNAGIKLRGTKDIKSLSGEGSHESDELSGANKEYATLSEAYLSYKYKNLTLSGGRQSINTPLADSDDIRMVPNSFEAYLASLKLEDMTLLAGFINKWQGSDAGLDSRWSETGDTFVASASYVRDAIESSLWYYNITNKENASSTIYFDTLLSFELNRDISLATGFQFLNQTEVNESGIESNIYGVMAELSGSDITVALAYNMSKKEEGKHSLSGFGGGALFTNMDTMILDEITQSSDASAVVGAISYEYNSLVSFTYAYGDFSADSEHIVEQDFIVEYIAKENLALSVAYILDSNEEYSDSEDFNSQNLRVFTSYSF